MQTLSNATLAQFAARPAPSVSGAVDVPAYPREGPIGVVHVGLGAFHRAHQALVFDSLLRQSDRRWGVLGVAMRNESLANALADQDGLYAVQIADNTGVRWQISGAIWRTCVAARDPTRVIEAIGAPDTRWITLTVTEKGYTPELATTLVSGLAIRHQQHLPGLTVASCDNLSHNGDRLKALCLAAAGSDAQLQGWISRTCAFPNSMVDRIVPASTPARRQAAADALGLTDQVALGTEKFWEWVIEDQFADPEDARLLKSAGVQVVPDVSPYEEAKLRMLNASHSAMAVIGAVGGLNVISECVANPAIHSYILGLMTRDVGPHMRRQDWASYRDALMARFANPLLQHSVHQIATDSSQKIPQRWVTTVERARADGDHCRRLAFAAAAWFRYLSAVDDAGNTYALNDPLADDLHRLALSRQGDAEATVQAMGTIEAIWGKPLSTDAVWLALVTYELQNINDHGMLGALHRLNAACVNAPG